MIFVNPFILCADLNQTGRYRVYPKHGYLSSVDDAKYWFKNEKPSGYGNLEEMLLEEMLYQWTRDKW